MVTNTNTNRSLLTAFLAGTILLGNGCCSVFHVFCPKLNPPPPAQQNSILNPIEASEVDMPFTCSLADAFNQAEQTVPMRHDAWDAWTFTEVDGVWAYEYSFWRDSLALGLNGDTLSIGLHGYYKARGGRRVGGHVVVLGSCGDGEPAREITANISTKFNFGSDWNLSSKSTLGGINFPNKCEVTGLNFDVTHYISDAVSPQIGSIPGIIDGKVASLNIQPIAQKVWLDLQQPIKINDTAWLLLSPEAVRLSSFNGSGNSLKAAVGLQAHPKLILGEKPNATSNPFPNLQNSPPGNGFHVALEGQLSLDTATTALKKQLVSRRYTFGKYFITITDVRVYGNGPQLVLQLGIDGSIKGTIYFTGAPTFVPATDSAPDQITVSDLDFSIETKNVLAKVANWLNHEGFRESIATEAKWPLTTAITDARSKLQAAINRPINDRATISGNILALRPIGFYSTSTALVARVTADGTVAVNVK